jgi:hypothetical protein
MSAGNYDITIDQGSDFKLTLVIKDGNTPRSLDGYAARGHLRASKDTAQYWAFDFTATDFTSNNTTGTVIMKMAHNVTANNGNTALSEGNYFYDVEIYKPDGNDAGTDDDEVERILQGKAKVTREVTR